MIKKAVILVVLGLCAAASARTITVDDDGPADFNNIQASVNDANEGDIVQVRPGIYYENIRMKDGITLQGSGPNVTTIDGGQNGHVVSFNLASGTISGFTITNGGNCPSSSAGIFTSQCTVKIKNNIIVNNCNGISISSNSDAIITGSKIINNERLGIRIMTQSSSVITNNVIAHNGSYGIFGSASAPFIINNTISHNGFIGILCVPECTHTISNNIVTNNEYGIWAHGGTSSPVPLLQITYNNFSYNTKANYWQYYGIIGGGFGFSGPFTPRPGTGEIEQNSLFADPYNGGYHLKSQAGRWEPNTQTWVQDEVTSPCVDVGNPMSAIGLEPFPNGGRINMGAYGGTSEASKSYFGKPPCETIVAGDVNGDCIVNFLDFCLMALRWCEDNNP